MYVFWRSKFKDNYQLITVTNIYGKKNSYNESLSPKIKVVSTKILEISIIIKKYWNNNVRKACLICFYTYIILCCAYKNCLFYIYTNTFLSLPSKVGTTKKFKYIFRNQNAKVLGMKIKT